MKSRRKYLIAVALLAVFAVVFGLAGASAPMSEPVSAEQSSSSSDSVTHFVNPPTYDSDWVNITDKCGQHVILVHNLSTMDVTVDITGRTANLTEENWHQFWSMGDVDEDGYITETDLDLIWDYYGSSDPQYDINEDGIVDMIDFSICAMNFGRDVWTYFGAGIHQRNFGGTAYMSGWSRTYGGTSNDIANSIVQTDDGGYALAGSTESYGAGDYDSWLVKTDSSGNMMWNKTYGGTGADLVRSVVQTSDGGYALAGFTDSFGAGEEDFWLVKTDLAGDEQWNKTYGGTDGEAAQSLVRTSDGGYALAGNTVSLGAGSVDFWLVKTDSAGNEQWNKTYGGANEDGVWSAVQTVDGGYAIVGQTHSFGASWDSWLVKVDSSGNHEWNKTYGGSNDDFGVSLVQTFDSGYALASTTLSFGAGNRDIWLVRTDSAGNVQWNKTYGGAGFETVWSMVQTGDYGYAMAGVTGGDFYLVKTDHAGNEQWNKTYGGKYDDRAYSVIETLDGGCAIAGFTDSFGSGGHDFWLVKTDVESGLAMTHLTNTTITLYRGKTDPYWNYVRVRIWLIKEPSWMYGDINQDGTVDAKDLAIIGQNYGKTFSAMSLGGIAAVAGVYAYKKRKQPK